MVVLTATAQTADNSAGAGLSSQSADPRSEARRWLEQGRQLRRAGDPYGALAAFARARWLQPDDAEIAQALADVLVDLGAPTAATEVLGPRTDLGLRSRIGGQRLRWSTAIPSTSPDPARRFDEVDRALAGLDALLAEARAASPRDEGLLRRLQRDRAAALRHRERWRDAIEQIEALRRDGDVPLPIYVQQAEADAKLALREPGAARILYDEALQRLSVDARAGERSLTRELLRGRFYAEEEDEDFVAAFATADALAALDSSRFAATAMTRRRMPMPTLGAMARSYGEMPAAAWIRMQPLVEGAPGLAWLHVSAAEIAAQRGWPRRAEADIEIARALAPDDFGTKIAQVDSDVRRHQLARADERIAPLLGPGAGMPALDRVKRDLDASMGPSVRFEMSASTQSRSACAKRKRPDSRIC